MKKYKGAVIEDIFFFATIRIKDGEVCEWIVEQIGKHSRISRKKLEKNFET